MPGDSRDVVNEAVPETTGTVPTMFAPSKKVTRSSVRDGEMVAVRVSGFPNWEVPAAESATEVDAPLILKVRMTGAAGAQ